MGVKVKVDLPNVPHGADVQISGLGIFTNGSTREVTEAEQEEFRNLRGRVVQVGDRAEDGTAAVEFQQGPALAQVFKDHPYISIVKDEPKPVLKQAAAAKE
jgi:hypothetical protein